MALLININQIIMNKPKTKLTFGQEKVLRMIYKGSELELKSFDQLTEDNLLALSNGKDCDYKKLKKDINILLNYYQTQPYFICDRCGFVHLSEPECIFND